MPSTHPETPVPMLLVPADPGAPWSWRQPQAGVQPEQIAWPFESGVAAVAMAFGRVALADAADQLWLAEHTQQEAGRSLSFDPLAPVGASVTVLELVSAPTVSTAAYENATDIDSCGIADTFGTKQPLLISGDDAGRVLGWPLGQPDNAPTLLARRDYAIADVSILGGDQAHNSRLASIIDTEGGVLVLDPDTRRECFVFTGPPPDPCSPCVRLLACRDHDDPTSLAQRLTIVYTARGGIWVSVTNGKVDRVWAPFEGAAFVAGDGGEFWLAIRRSDGAISRCSSDWRDCQPLGKLETGVTELRCLDALGQRWVFRTEAGRVGEFRLSSRGVEDCGVIAEGVGLMVVPDPIRYARAREKWRSEEVRRIVKPYLGTGRQELTPPDTAALTELGASNVAAALSLNESLRCRDLLGAIASANELVQRSAHPSRLRRLLPLYERLLRRVGQSDLLDEVTNGSCPNGVTQAGCFESGSKVKPSARTVIRLGASFRDACEAATILGRPLRGRFLMGSDNAYTCHFEPAERGVAESFLHEVVHGDVDTDGSEQPFEVLVEDPSGSTDGGAAAYEIDAYSVAAGIDCLLWLTWRLGATGVIFHLWWLVRIKPVTMDPAHAHGSVPTGEGSVTPTDFRQLNQSTAESIEGLPERPDFTSWRRRAAAACDRLLRRFATLCAGINEPLEAEA